MPKPKNERKHWKKEGIEYLVHELIRLHLFVVLLARKTLVRVPSRRGCRLPIGQVTVGLFGVSGKRSRNAIFRLPKPLVSACEPTHPRGCKSTSWLLPDLTTLKVFRHEAFFGNHRNEERKALQDEHREDTGDEAVSDIERDYSEYRSASHVKGRRQWSKRTRNEDDSQETRKSVSLSNKSITITNHTDERHTI